MVQFVSLIATPVFRKNTEDFSASTENTTGQGYWFKVDQEHQDEIILFVKTPPGVVARERTPDSPYRSNTIRFRFLNWLPRKATRARMKDEEARKEGNLKCALELEFRAARFEDMSEQLLNTIAFQQAKRTLSKVQSRKEGDDREIETLKSKIKSLTEARRSAPPLLLQQGHKAILSIPFLAPDELFLRSVLSLGPLTTEAGVDKGLRFPVVVSVQDGGGVFHEKKIDKTKLYEKRKRLRKRTKELQSQIALRRNNWEKKHPELKAPVYILKKERDLESVGQRVAYSCPELVQSYTSLRSSFDEPCRSLYTLVHEQRG